jgi:murein DD-endopeptidase MepM/ murein hydrolase activator NlpD
MIISINSGAQNRYGDILDTIVVNDKSVILFSNKRWTYAEDYKINLSYDSLFFNNWNTKDIHAYFSGTAKLFKNFSIYLYENNSAFVFPLDTFKYLRGFRGNHTGLDLKADLGDSIRAAFDGRIRFAANIHNGYGNLVIIRHYNGLETYYSHLSKILVQVNDDVKSGDIIGLVGQTGRATTHHLHFETRYHDWVFDPTKIISLQNKMLLSDSLAICSSLFSGGSCNPNIESPINGEPRTQYYTVVKGDTLSKISKLYATTVENLCQINDISKNSILQIGQKLKVAP